MTLEQLYSLNEDEIAMLWYIVNKIDKPVLAGIELEPQLFTAINKKTLIQRINNAESLIKEESKAVYESLKSKVI